MLKVDFSKQAWKFLEKLPLKQSKQIIARIESFIENPKDIPSVAIRWFSPFRRIKSWEYRVIYYIEGENLYIDIIDKRNDDTVYKRLYRRNKK